MKEHIDFALAIGCPLLQALHMVDMIVGYRYRSNLPYWTSPEAEVIANLKATQMTRFGTFGYDTVVHDVCEIFEVN
jgi:hypothetical protein